jgi:23S rRNA (uracil1939-C5)-methyltransferase
MQRYDIAMNTCPYFPRCTGCSHRDLNYDDQRQLKTSHLRQLFQSAEIEAPAPEFFSCGQQGLRHRVDFTVQYNEFTKAFDFGFYDREKNLIDISECLQLAPALQQSLTEFRNFNFFHGDTPLKKGSVRLRVGPSGIKGCWLDFSNLDIKGFLTDGRLLKSLLGAGFFVEIGQKGKRLAHDGEKLFLDSPSPQPWFATSGISMLGLISDFTQPSWITGDALVEQTFEWVKKLKPGASIVEFGAGLGQFTLPLLKLNMNVHCFEISDTATSSLRASAELHQLSKNLTISVGDFHRAKPVVTQSPDLAFVNPARSGLKNFAHELLSFGTEKIIYVSCFPESMVADAKILGAGYKIKALKIVDQFPQTGHFETCMLLEKNQVRE